MSEKPFIENKTEFAAKYGISRPTLNQWIDWYLEGKRDKIRDRDVAEAIDLAYKKHHGEDDTTELDTIQKEVGEVYRRIEVLDESIMKIREENKSLRFKPEDSIDEISRKHSKKEENDAKEDELTSQLTDAFRQYDRLMERKAEITGIPNVKRIATKTKLTPTYAYFDDGKCMIVIDGWGYENYCLYLYAKIKGQYIYLKRYASEFEEQIIIIDDIVFDAPLFYCVYGVADKEYQLSGMCRLVPANEGIKAKR